MNVDGISAEQAAAMGATVKKIYVHVEYPKMCAHPAYPDDRKKDVLCQNEDEEIDYYYGFTDEGKELIAKKKAEQAEEDAALAEKKDKVQQVKAAAIKQSIAAAKTEVEKRKAQAIEAVAKKSDKTDKKNKDKKKDEIFD